MSTVTTLALGSNLGDRDANLDAAGARLAALPDSRIAARSSRHATPAMMPDGAPPDWDIPFLNEVILFETPLAPRALLAAIKGIETAIGRTAAPRWAPRVIDIDILACGDLTLATPDLTVPHPELARRRFVLAPWAEVDPHWRHPITGRTVAQMLAALPQ